MKKLSATIQINILGTKMKTILLILSIFSGQGTAYATPLSPATRALGEVVGQSDELKTAVGRDKLIQHIKSYCDEI